jgi:signal transduction histidine kinase
MNPTRSGATAAAERLHPVVRLDYLVRVVVYPVAMLVLYSVFRGSGRASLEVIVLLTLQGLALPHLYYLAARSSRDSKRAEHRNLTVDSFLMGCWVAAMHFSVWPSVMILAGPHTGGLSVGGVRLAVRNIVAAVAGVLLIGAFTGFEVVLASGPIPTMASIGGIFTYMSVFAYHSHLQTKQTIRGRKQLEQRAQEIEETTEELAQAKEEAEAANRSKSAFLANMSHELRTPLNAVIGLSDIMIEDAGFDGNEAIIPDLVKIKGAGEHLLELINEVLDLSKIEAGKVELYIEEFPVAALLESVVGTVGAVAAQNGNRLVVEPHDAGVMTSDMVKVRQMLLNLLSNACKFTENGEVRLSARRERTVEGEWLVFEVADTGIGMNAEQQAKIFQPFTQADSSTTRKYGGTGLGLVISARFAALLGGSIGMESELGVGTTFTIRLPASSADDAEPESVAEPAPSPGSREGVLPTADRPVMVVENDATTRDMLRKLLERQSWPVVEAVNGRKALERLDESRPALVILDLMMPEMDGFAFLQALQERNGGGDIPVVVLTARELSREEEGRFAGRVHAVLEKGSYSQDELLDAVRGALGDPVPAR